VVAPLPPAVIKQYRHVEELLMSNDNDGAAAELQPLVAAYPAHAVLRVLGCRVEIARHGVEDPGAIATCDRAADLSADPRPALEIAALRRSKGDTAGERATIVAAEARVASLPPAQAAAAWLVLADHYREIEAVTWAENALVNAGPVADDHGIGAWVKTTR